MNRQYIGGSGRRFVGRLSTEMTIVANAVGWKSPISDGNRTFTTTWRSVTSTIQKMHTSEGRWSACIGSVTKGPDSGKYLCQKSVPGRCPGINKKPESLS
jgi:hypothetical protein